MSIPDRSRGAAWMRAKLIPIQQESKRWRCSNCIANGNSTPR